MAVYVVTRTEPVVCEPPNKRWCRTPIGWSMHLLGGLASSPAMRFNTLQITTTKKIYSFRCKTSLVFGDSKSSPNKVDARFIYLFYPLAIGATRKIFKVRGWTLSIILVFHIVKLNFHFLSTHVISVRGRAGRGDDFENGNVILCHQVMFMSKG